VERQTIKVEGMSCGHCKNAVEKAVKALAGVSLAEVDLAAKKLTVEYDRAQTTLAQIKEVIEAEGYTVV